MRALILALVFVVPCAANVCAGPQFDSARPSSAQKPGAKEPVETDAKPEPKTQTGPAPARVELGEPVRPSQLQTRDGGQIATDPRARYRTVVKMMITVERTHRERVARLERLRALFAESNATESLAVVDRLAAIELAKYTAAMSGYERGLGTSIYAQVRAVIDTRGGTPSSAIPPSPPPAEPAAGDGKPKGR